MESRGAPSRGYERVLSYCNDDACGVVCLHDCVYNTKCDVFGFPVAVNRLNFKKVSTFFILLKDCYVASKAVS